MKIFGRALAGLMACLFVMMAALLPSSAAHAQSAPTITSVTPNSGPTNSNTTVTITGTNFLTASSVRFGGVNAVSFTKDSATQITAITPTQGAGSVTVSVTNDSGNVNSLNAFTYLGPPIISNGSPLSGPLAGGTVVTITGSNMTGVTAVSFDGVAATSVSVLNASNVQATTPAGSALGFVNVSVTSPSGTYTAQNFFQYVSVAPTIGLVSPSSGSVAGGNRVAINGSNFTGATSVTFGGVPALYYTVSGSINAVAPAGSLGAVDVAVTTPNGSVTRPNAYTYTDPTIAAISGILPSQGSIAGGNEIAITGTNFTGATAVTFGGTAATSFTVVSQGRILAVVPATGSSGPATVVVTAPAGTATRSNGYTYNPTQPAPTITSVTPTNISVDGGLVTINGTNLYAVTAVTFNGVRGTSITESVTNTSISVIAPAGSIGPVTVALTTSGGGTVTRANAINYIADPLPVISGVSPASGSRGGGTTVTITGTNFNGATIVNFGSLTGTSLSVVSPTQITVVTPSITDIGSQIVTVTTPGGTSLNNTNSRFVYTSSSIPLPVISAVSPNSGATAGGTSVTITGANFSGTASVRFGGVAATSFLVNSGTRITAVAPAGSAGAVDVSLTALGGTVTSNGAFTYGAPQQQLASQSISFTSTAPSGAVFGGATYTPTATATSGLSVALSVDASSSATCSISGGVVSFTGAGTCRINADQAGDSSFAAATQVQQSFSVSPAAPTITTVAPSSGTTAGGTSVVITGANFIGTPTVTFGSSAATSVTLNSATQITAVAPAGSAGAVDVAVTTSAGTATSNGAFTYVAQQQSAPTITTVAPSSGTTAGGTSVVITGANFIGTPTVTFGSSAATSVTLNSATQITAVAPSGSAGAVNVAVTTSAGTATSNGAFTYVALVGAPSITITSPLQSSTTINEPFSRTFTATGGTGPYTYSLASGTLPTGVTLSSGGILSGTPTARGIFNYTVTATDASPAGPYSVTQPFELNVFPAIIVSPSGGLPDAIIQQPYNVVLTVSGGTAPYTLSVPFNPLPPGLSLSSGGVITGTPTTVGSYSFNICALDSSSNPGPFNACFAAKTLNVISSAAPTITAVGPNSGTAAGGTTVIIAGTNFTGTPTVRFGNTAASSVVVNSLTQVTAVAPAGSAGVVDVTVTTVTGTATFPGGYTYESPPVAPTAANLSNVAVAYGSSGSAIDVTNSVSGVFTSISVATAPAHGTTSVAGNVVTYTPTAGYYGADSFAYTATGPGGTSSPATVSLTVATPAAPVGVDRTGVAVAFNSQGTAVDLSTSVSGVSTSISVATAPAHGTTSVAGNVITYTPTAGYYGADSFTYTATGPGGTSSPATVSLTVATPAAPVGVDRTGVAVAYGSTGTAVDLSGSVSGVASSISVGTAPAHGTTSVAGLVITYTPTAEYYGADSFTYTATGPGGTSVPASVALTVATPAAPVVMARSGVAVAFNSQGTAIDLSSSVSGVSTGISVVTAPTRGTTRIAGNVVTYTPNVDKYGADSFTFTATGPGGTSSPATVSLTVAGSAPRVQPQNGSTSDGQMVSIELTRGAAIGPFTAAQVVSVSPANAATASITSTGDGAARRYFVEATPAARFGRTITINYTLTNAFGVSPVGVVTLTVAARPDPSNDPKVRALTDAQVQATRRFGRSQIANFMRRNEQLHSGRARSSQSISVNIIDPTRERRPEDSMAPAVMPKRDSDKPDVTESHYAAPAAQDEKPAGVLGAMSMWVSGAIDIATRDASSFAPKLSATTQGISGGVDFQISKRTAIGFGAGYGNVTSNINAKAAELDATSNLVAVYGSTKLFENGFVDVVAGRGFLDYKTRRRIDGTELTALGSRTGTMNLAAISFGFNKQVEDLDWSFYSKLEYMDAKLAAYTETSGGTRNNLRLSALDDTSYSAGLGFRLQKAFATGIGPVTPRLRGEFGREFGKANVQYVDYADINDTAARSINLSKNNRNFYETSIGTMIDLKDDWSFDLEYALMYNTATLSSGIKVQLSKAF